MIAVKYFYLKSRISITELWISIDKSWIFLIQSWISDFFYLWNPLLNLSWTVDIKSRISITELWISIIQSWDITDLWISINNHEYPWSFAVVSNVFTGTSEWQMKIHDHRQGRSVVGFDVEAQFNIYSPNIFQGHFRLTLGNLHYL